MDEKTNPTEAAAEAVDETTTAAEAQKPVRASKNSTSAPAKEPTQASAVPAASAEPAAVPSAPNAAVSGAKVDPIAYSKAVPTPKNGPRRSLTVYHVQRRLAEHGHTEAWSETKYADLTRRSVAAWQESRGDAATGILTRKQFEDLFKGDPNVDAQVDTIGDHDGSVG